MNLATALYFHGFRGIPAHAPGVETDEGEDVEKWSENEVQQRHEQDRPVQQIDVRQVLVRNK